MSRTKRLDRLDQSLIQNGNFKINQRGTSGDLGYVTDRFRTTQSGPTSANVSAAVVAEVPFGDGNSLKYECDTTFSPSGTQVFGVMQGIEGNFFNVIGQEVSLSFYVRANHLATYSTNLVGNAPSGDSYKYATPFTIEAVDTWQKVDLTVTIPGTVANWNQDSNSAMTMILELMAGTEATSLVDQWNLTGSNQRGVVGQDNFFDTIGNTIQISKVVMKRGKPMGENEFVGAGRDYQEELEICKRYFERLNYGTDGMVCTGVIQNSSQITGHIEFSEKRDIPAITTTLGGGNGWQFFNLGSGTNCNATLAQFNNTTFKGTTIFYIATHGAGANGSGGYFKANTAGNGIINISADY